MKESKVILKNGNPCLCIGSEELSACAYITYFEERNDYSLFAEKGFKIYSVSVSLAAQPINAASGFMPHTGGVFDKKGEVDFSPVDDAVRKILKSCPQAYIFPRIYVCMPQWWIDENPAETIAVPHNKRREALYSEKFRKDAAEMLRVLIRHFKTFFAADNIFGYQISGGNTQEWFHPDLNGGYCENALPYFNKYLLNKGRKPVNFLPSLDEMHNERFIKDDLTKEYIRFANESVAETIEYLCKAAKETAEHKQIVGVFYGYTAEVPSHLWGTHALKPLLNSENIDFFSSPNSYMGSRALGIDWGDMMPADSVKLHGKMCFIECDIRTFLSKSPGASRKGSDPYNYYTDAVWAGPPTEELSVWALRKSLAKQLTSGNGLWWFDMFGHWFATENLMKEMKISLDLYNTALNQPHYENRVEVALFLDEESHCEIGEKHPGFRLPHTLRKPLGNAGAPYKMYLASDFYNIDWDKSDFKAVIFNTPYCSEFVLDAMNYLKTLGIGVMCTWGEKVNYTARDITEFYKENNVFLFNESGDVFYIGNGYCALHAATEGEKNLKFPEKLKCTDVVTKETFRGSSVSFMCRQFETRLFRIEKKNSY